MPVRRKLVNVVLLSENNQLFAKIAKTHFYGHTSSFFNFFERKKLSLIFDEKSKTDLGFEIEQPQRTCQRRATLKSLVNLDVPVFP